MALAIVDIETFDFNPWLMSPGGRETWEVDFWRKGATMIERRKRRRGGGTGLLRTFLEQEGRAVRETIINA